MCVAVVVTGVGIAIVDVIVIIIRCDVQYERASIGPTGAIAATTGVCRGPYDALNGSALAWCAAAAFGVSVFGPADIICCCCRRPGCAPAGCAPYGALRPSVLVAMTACCELSIAPVSIAPMLIARRCGARRYNSTSYYDDMTWAATWMYQATKQPTYLKDAISYYVLHSQVRLPERSCRTPQTQAAKTEPSTVFDQAPDVQQHKPGCGIRQSAAESDKTAALCAGPGAGV